MYGIAGKDEGEKNAIATAAMMNQFTTKRIITMNLTIFFVTELNSMVKRGEFIPANRNERLKEIGTLLEYLDPKKATVFDTTHPTNIIKVKGTLPQDKGLLVQKITNHIEC